jgi:hypothetical protein
MLLCVLWILEVIVRQWPLYRCQRIMERQGLEDGSGILESGPGHQQGRFHLQPIPVPLRTRLTWLQLEYNALLLNSTCEFSFIVITLNGHMPVGPTDVRFSLSQKSLLHASSG